MLQPPYSPDLAPCDFFLFQKVKSTVKGYRFESTEDIHRCVTRTFKRHPTKYVPGMLQWQHRRKRCVQAQGMYFEGDHIVVDA